MYIIEIKRLNAILLVFLPLLCHHNTSYVLYNNIYDG